MENNISINLSSERLKAFKKSMVWSVSFVSGSSLLISENGFFNHMYKSVTENIASDRIKPPTWALDFRTKWVTNVQDRKGRSVSAGSAEWLCLTEKVNKETAGGEVDMFSYQSWLGWWKPCLFNCSLFVDLKTKLLLLLAPNIHFRHMKVATSNSLQRFLRSATSLGNQGNCPACHHPIIRAMRCRTCTASKGLVFSITCLQLPWQR